MSCTQAPVLQKEIPSMEDIIEEERGYFLRTDRDGDKKLSKAEFVQHFLDSMGEWQKPLFSHGMHAGGLEELYYM